MYNFYYYFILSEYIGDEKLEYLILRSYKRTNALEPKSRAYLTHIQAHIYKISQIKVFMVINIYSLKLHLHIHYYLIYPKSTVVHRQSV